MTKLNRTFYLNTEVSQESLLEIIKGIREVYNHDKEENNKLKEYNPQPVELFIDSFGGSVYSGLALANLMLEVGKLTPIHTYCYGKAMSMGLFLFIHGTKRFAHKDATFMQHQLSAGAFGKMGDLDITVHEYKRLHELVTNRIVELTKISKNKIEKKQKLKEDWYFDGKKALELGVATDLIE